MFHYFHDEVKYPKSQGSLSAMSLEKVINHPEIKVINFPDWVNKFKLNILKDNETCFTFDDGIREQLDIALPVLDKYNLKANFNVCSFQLLNEKDNFEIHRYFRNNYFDNINDYYHEYFGFCKIFLKNKYDEIIRNVDFNSYLTRSEFYTFEDRKFRYFRDEVLKESHLTILDNMMDDHGLNRLELHERLWITPDELKAISDQGHTIGLHSHEHSTNIIDYNHSQQYESYKKNKEILEDIIDKEIKSCAYPCGKSNEDTYIIMDQLGIEVAFNAHDSDVGSCSLQIPRIDSTNLIKKLKIN